MIDGQNFSDQPVGSNMRTYGNNRKIGTGEAVDYTTGCLLDYLYFKDYHQMIAIDLSKKKNPWFGPKAIQEIIFNGNLS